MILLAPLLCENLKLLLLCPKAEGVGYFWINVNPPNVFLSDGYLRPRQ